MQITDYIGDAWYVTDDLREDGSNIDMLMAQRSIESTRAIQENFETRFLEVANEAQVDADPNLINGFPHRIASTQTDNVFALEYLIDMGVAFNKANVPSAGRIFIVDPVVEGTLNKLVSITNDVTPFAAAILERGLADGQRFLMNFYGWDIMTSNRLPKGDFSDGTTTVTDGVANIAMSILDDQTKPVMAAWRRQPKAEGKEFALSSLNNVEEFALAA